MYFPIKTFTFALTIFSLFSISFSYASHQSNIEEQFNTQISSFLSKFENIIDSVNINGKFFTDTTFNINKKFPINIVKHLNFLSDEHYKLYQLHRKNNTDNYISNIKFNIANCTDILLSEETNNLLEPVEHCSEYVISKFNIADLLYYSYKTFDELDFFESSSKNVNIQLIEKLKIMFMIERIVELKEILDKNPYNNNFMKLQIYYKVFDIALNTNRPPIFDLFQDELVHYNKIRVVFNIEDKRTKQINPR